MNTQKLVLVIALLAALSAIGSVVKPADGYSSGEESTDTSEHEGGSEETAGEEKQPELPASTGGGKPEKEQGYTIGQLGSLISGGPKKAEALAGSLLAGKKAESGGGALKEKVLDKGDIGEKDKKEKDNNKLQMVEKEKEKEKFDFFGLAKIGDWTKLIFNPLELAKSICNFFAIPIEQFFELLGHPQALGPEALLYPLVVSSKIVEEAFIPDECKLRFVCSMGKHLDFAKETVLKFSPNFLEGSSNLKALSEGISGSDCSNAQYKDSIMDCKPSLTKPFESISGLLSGGHKSGGASKASH